MIEAFDHSFEATELEAREGIGVVITELRRMGLGDDRAGDIEIALAEAVNNVVEHAYRESGNGTVGISCQWSKDQLTLRIIDAGQPMRDGELPLGLAADVSVAFEDLPEGGFGWFLIRQLTRSIDYEREDGKNTLSLVFDADAS